MDEDVALGCAVIAAAIGASIAASNDGKTSVYGSLAEIRTRTAEMGSALADRPKAQNFIGMFLKCLAAIPAPKIGVF